MDINAQVHSLYILRRVPQRRNHTMKTNTPIKSIQPAGPDRLINPRGIAVLVSALGLAFLLSTGVTGNPTALYFSTHSFGTMRSRSTTRGGGMVKRALATDRSQPESAWRERFGAMIESCV